MKVENENAWDILEKVNDPFAGMLKCLYSIKFICKKELTEEQNNKAFTCLNVIAENEKNDNEVRAWCYNQLGNIKSGTSTFIKL